MYSSHYEKQTLIRKYLYIYSPTIVAAIQAAAGTPIDAQISYGLSVGGIAATPSSLISNTCSQDWIEVNYK